MKRWVGAMVDRSGRHPLVVLLLALCVLVGTWHFALRVLTNPHTDLRELLPRDSPGLKAFEHQLGRVGGGATLLVVAQSPDRKQNERFIDDLSGRLASMMAGHGRVGPKLIAYVESGTKDVHAFFERNKWLYADQKDLERADDTLDQQIAIRSGWVEDLDDDGPPASVGPSAPGSRAPKKAALGLDEYWDRWKANAKTHDDFPTGYFETPDGTMIGLRVVSSTTGMGDAGGDLLLGRLKQLVVEMNPSTAYPLLTVGFAGDIPNAAAEKASIVSQAAWASAFGFVLIVAGVVWFYRSAWSLLVISLPALIGVGAAYAFAYWRFGYVNTTGMFLGVIILGNGINYPIVLLSRYREFRCRGQSPAEARREAVQNALRAELVGACVASIAYGSLTVTQFRGFNQFGWIGFVGMLLVWVSMIPVVPALLTVIAWIENKLPPRLRDSLPYGDAPALGPSSSWKPDPRPWVWGLLGGVALGLTLCPLPFWSAKGLSLLAEWFARRTRGWRGPVAFTARATERAPRVFLAIAAAVTLLAAARIPSFLRDPWEYNFDRLGSRGSKQGGAGEWSNKAERVFGGKMNVAGALMLADSPGQVPALKAQILANDASDPQGRLIAQIATVFDLLPGTVAEQKKKLEVLARIRSRLTPAVLEGLPADERTRVEQLDPPVSLRVLEPKDLPPLLRRRFEENDGRIGTVFYVKYKNDVSLSDGHNLLRIAKSTDNVRLPSGVVVQTASRSTVFAEMIRSMERDGPRATLTSLLMVVVVVLVATRDLRGAFAVLLALAMGVTWLLGGAAMFGEKLNYVNFITLPITFGIGCEYPFNVYDRSRLLHGDVRGALERVGGAVALCSFTTAVGYASLLFADFQALQSFGRLAVSGEVACLTGALLMLPALLHILGRRTMPAGSGMERSTSARDPRG